MMTALLSTVIDTCSICLHKWLVWLNVNVCFSFCTQLNGFKAVMLWENLLKQIQANLSQPSSLCFVWFELFLGKPCPHIHLALSLPSRVSSTVSFVFILLAFWLFENLCNESAGSCILQEYIQSPMRLSFIKRYAMEMFCFFWFHMVFIVLKLLSLSFFGFALETFNQVEKLSLCSHLWGAQKGCEVPEACIAKKRGGYS